jgi:hypothetical protein
MLNSENDKENESQLRGRFGFRVEESHGGARSSVIGSNAQQMAQSAPVTYEYHDVSPAKWNSRKYRTDPMNISSCCPPKPEQADR